MTDTRAKPLTRPEAAEYLGVSPATLVEWAYRNKGPRYSKIGRHVRYRLADLEQFLDDNSRGGTVPAPRKGK